MGLRHQEAIDWVAVVEGESRHPQGVTVLDGETFDTGEAPTSTSGRPLSRQW